MYRICKQKVTEMAVVLTKRKSSMMLQQSKVYSTTARRQCLPAVLFVLIIVVANINIESVSATDINAPPSAPMMSYQSNFPSSVPISFGTTTEIPIQIPPGNISESPSVDNTTFPPTITNRPSTTMSPIGTNSTSIAPSITTTNTSSNIPTSIPSQFENTTIFPTITDRPSTMPQQKETNIPVMSPVTTPSTTSIPYTPTASFLPTTISRVPSVIPVPSSLNVTSIAPSTTPTNTSSNIPTSIPSLFDNTTIMPSITDRPSTMPQQKETNIPVMSPAATPSTTSIPNIPTASLLPTTISRVPNTFNPSVIPVQSALNVTPIALTTVVPTIVPIVTPIVAPTNTTVSVTVAPLPTSVDDQGTVPQASFTVTSIPNASPTTAEPIPNSPVSMQVTTSIPIAFIEPTIQKATEESNSTGQAFVPEVSTEDTNVDRTKMEQTSKRSFWLIHGILLAVAWVIVMPSSIGVSLLQDMFPSVQLLYSIRKTATIFGILITTIGFGISVATIQQEGTTHFRSNTHSKVGLAVFIVALVHTLYDLYIQEKMNTVQSSPPTTDNVVSIGKRTQVEEISDEEQDGGDIVMDNARTTGGNNRIGHDIDMFENDSNASSTTTTAWEVLNKILGLIIIGISWYTCYTGIRIYETRYDIDYSILLWGCMGGIVGAFIIVYACSKA